MFDLFTGNSLNGKIDEERDLSSVHVSIMSAADATSHVEKLSNPLKRSYHF